MWWWNDASSNLALMLAYLMTRMDPWDETAIRLLVPALAADAAALAGTVEERLQDIRIGAGVEIVVDADARAVAERSRDAAVVFLPLRFAGRRVVDPFGGPLEELLQVLPVAALVGAAADVGLMKAEEVDAPPESASG